MVRKPLMPAAVVFALSAVACRNFLIYYWRAPSLRNRFNGFVILPEKAPGEKFLVLGVQWGQYDTSIVPNRTIRETEGLRMIP